MSWIIAAGAQCRRNLLAFKGNLRLILFWPVAGVLVASVAWAALYKQLTVERHRADAAALQIVSKNALAEAQRIGRSLAMIDQMLGVVKMQWQLLDANVKLQSLKDREPFFGSTFELFILDAAGDLQLSTAPPGAGKRFPNLAEQAFFKAQKQAGTDMFFIGAPIHLAAGRPLSVNYSRRLLNADASFAGVAAFSINAQSLVADYDDATLGGRGLLEVVGDDGVSRAARIGPQQAAFALVPQRLATLRFQNGGARFLEGDLFSDQRNRYLAWQAVPGYPLTAFVGLDQQDYLALHLERRAASLNTAIGATLALALLILVATCLSARLAWKNHLLQHAHTTYRIATEGGDDGFFIVCVVLDGRGEVSDFEVLDCNARGAAMFGRAREDCIGSTLAHWRICLAAEQLLAILGSAFTSGKSTAELQLHDPRHAGEPQYLRLRAVRSGQNLALTLQDMSFQYAHVAMLERSSNEDMLTGLPNRAWAQRSLAELIARAAQEQEQVALLFIDLDGFKAVNDGLGHAAGDEVLKHAGARLKSAIRPDNQLARLGGDEFIVIVRNVRHRDDAAHVARRVLLAFYEEFSTAQGKARLGTSIGISLFPDDAQDADALLNTADVAMYAVKQRGKNNFGFFGPEIGAVRERRRQRGEALRLAIAQDQFVLHYQPRIDLRSGRATSVEALVHWCHPEDGLVGTEELLALAAEAGLILELAELVIHKVCAQAQLWQQRSGEPIVPVALTLCDAQSREVDLPIIFAQALQRYPNNARAIEVAWQEAALIEQPLQVAHAMLALQQLGINIVLDNFRGGYAALAPLHHLTFATVRVAKAFAGTAAQDPRGDRFLAAIIAMAHALGSRVAVEGVEEAIQVRMLRQLECDEGQGNFLARPVPASPQQADIVAAERLSIDA